MFPRLLSNAFLGCFVLVLFCGCGGTHTEPVTGVVTLDGEPMPGVRVIFHPIEGNRKNSVGITDESGSYALIYTMSDTGAIVGQYKVLFSKKLVTDKGEKELLPRKFNQESPFTADVTSSGDNKFDFKLESE